MRPLHEKAGLSGERPALLLRIRARPDTDGLAVSVRGPGLHARSDADIVVVNADVNRFTRVGRDALADELQILQTNVLGAVASVAETNALSG